LGQARSIGILTVLNGVGAVVGVANSIVVAFFFGTTRTVEIFFAATGLQASITRLSQTGQVGEIFLPIYHRIKREKGADQAHQAFSIIFNWMLLVSGTLAAALWLAAPLLMKLRVPGFSASDLQLGVVLFRALIPVAVVRVAIALIRTLANAERWFGPPEAVGVGGHVLIVATTVALVGPLGVWALVVALWVGNGGILIALVILVLGRGIRYHFCLRKEGFSAWVVFRKTFATLGYVGATQVYAFALDAGLSMLPQGTFAAFRYARLLYAKTSSVLLRPVSIVFFTHFSEALARGAKGLRGLAQAALAGSLAISTLVIAAMWVASRPLLGGLWGPERFGVEQLDLAAFLVAMLYLLALPSALGQIARKTSMSLGFVTSHYVLASIVQVLTALMVWLLIRQFGTAGALGGVMAGATLLGLVHLVPLILWKRDLVVLYEPRLVVRWAVAGLAAVGAGWALGQWIGADRVTTRWPMLGVGLVLAAATMTVAAAAAWLLGIYEVREGVRRLRAVVRHSRRGGGDSVTQEPRRTEDM